MVHIGLPVIGAAALLLSASIAPSGACAGTTPDGLSFAVTVSRNGGPPFKDCFSFDTKGRLTVSGLSRYGLLPYADKPYGTDVTWLSAAAPGFTARFGAGLMYAGQVDYKGNLAATGLSTPNYTYAITGTPTTSCTAAASYAPDGWLGGR